MKSNKPSTPRRIELLAPARNLECGIEAVNHGADAVYIGAPRFGARAAAGNSLADIAALVNHAHLFNVRVYVALNTILHDDELPETEQMIWDLYHIGVDAIIVQDMGITRLNLPPVALHASTQMDNRSAEKVGFLHRAGFRQVVLPRELTLNEIAQIHKACPDTALEVFIHGALCVSYSGQCYVSEACYGRSANRGECAQFCRLAFDMVDAGGRTVVRNRHLLSLKDMNQTDNLEALLDAGASSLKIEGRLKDAAYVKNITAWYRKKLDDIFKRRKDYRRASSGKVELGFDPLPEKSFNRGFTDYFVHGRNGGIFSFDTPKSMGEEVGTVKEVGRSWITVAGIKRFANGDGLCFLDGQGRLQGFRVNRVEGNRLFVQEVPHVAPKTRLFRNFDQEFERILQRQSAVRRVEVDMNLGENAFGFTLSLTDEDGNRASASIGHAKETARSPQDGNRRTQLAKLGGTPLVVRNIEIELSDNWFIPSSVLADLRRRATEALLKTRRMNYRRETVLHKATAHPYPAAELTYLGNVMNSRAAAFYHDHGVKRVAPAFEKEKPQGAVLMFCKHCLRYSMGWCPVHHKVRSPFREPYYLVSSDGRRFRLEFDCKVCQMKVYADSES